MDIETILSRIQKSYGLKKDKEVANLIGLGPNDFSNRKKRGSLLKAIVEWAAHENVSLDWLVYGRGDASLTEDERESILLNKAKTILTSGSRYADNLSDHIEDYFRLLELDTKEGLPPEGTNNLAGE